MKTYQFSLLLKDVDENTPGLEDALFQAGCDDALLHFRAGAAYLDFDREAPSLEEAILSAITGVESSSIKMTVCHVAPENLVTESEIAKRLEVKRQTVSLWIKGKRRVLFPRPFMKLTEKSPLWKWTEVTEWLYINKIKNEKALVNDAHFIDDLNDVLVYRDKKVQKKRIHLLEKLENRTN